MDGLNLETTPIRDDDVKSASRVLDVLEFVAQRPDPASAVEISAALGMPRSSLHYLLLTLVRRGQLEQVGAQGSYQRGPALVELARNVLNPEGVLSAIRPLLKDLCSSINETAAYHEIRGDFAERVLGEAAEHPLLISMPIGALTPLYATAQGKVLLAAMNDEQIDDYIRRTRFKRLTPATVKSGAALKRQMEEIRRTGLAISHEEFSLGVVAVAMALRQGGRVIGALSFAMPTVRFDPDVAHEAELQLRAAIARFQRQTP